MAGGIERLLKPKEQKIYCTKTSTYLPSFPESSVTNEGSLSFSYNNADEEVVIYDEAVIYDTYGSNNSTVPLDVNDLRNLIRLKSIKKRGYILQLNLGEEEITESFIKSLFVEKDELEDIPLSDI